MQRRLRCVNLFTRRYPSVRYICRNSFAISIAERAASNPLFPALVPALSIACYKVSVVSTPKETGTPESSVTCAIPFVTSALK